MAEIATNISARLKNPKGLTNVAGPHDLRGELRLVTNQTVVMAAAAAAADTIFLGYLEPGEYIDPNMSYVASADIDADSTGNYVFNIGFLALNSAASAKNEAGTAVSNDPDLFAEDLTISGPGIKRFGEATNFTAYHVTPVRFKERVEIWATLVAETTPDADVTIAWRIVATH